jgi:glycosyltransferase involved in cell wall biosynthesis
MYLSKSYERSGELVPKEYIDNEKQVLHSSNKILTPSDSEKQDMIDFFGVDSEKIKVIPRGYSSNIKATVKKISFPVELLYIASIKEQKNTIEAITLLKELNEQGINSILHLAGSYQNDSILNECKKYVIENRLCDKIIFHGVLPQLELAKLISQSHINISVSNWETFGRGIFEGMAGGLPTVAFSHLECVKQYVNDGCGINFVNSHSDFLKALIKLCKNTEYYKKQSKKAYLSVEYLSEANERKKLIKELI